MGRIGEFESSGDLKRVGNVVFGADQEVARWLAERIPGFVVSDRVRSLGIVVDGKLSAGVVFERWNGVHVEASIAAEPGARWASRSTLFSMFYYPFVTLGVKAITVTVPHTNLQSLNLATKLGFEPEAIVQFAAHDGSSLIVLKMFRDRCRWIDHGQGQQSTRGTGPAGNSGSGSAV